MRTVNLYSDQLALDPDFYELLVSSHARFVRDPLADFGSGPNWMYQAAPFAVVAHDAERDPKFVYANMTAQRVFGYSWKEFIALPSRLSARIENREERRYLLDAVSRNGSYVGYEGSRVKKSGEIFSMEDGVIWQLVDDHGHCYGQAAMFSRWTNVHTQNDPPAKQPAA
ncbi:MEKHLA domain-containing protein [Aurantimonas aggregata]|uniref:MEKHLA domain-containing protein n=1 Tax=Aurantimonas aggregata TaxID=2047720 RepID=A0A6L9MMS8_9HYPH|nr:MEKHLA domain-containing protein [Aurantimonas aggregata]NDV89254.1 MEKHLA domain-containing protein [Aurantimonas aggregata]